MPLTDEQKALRKTGIGGSEVAAVLGLSPWAKPIDVWRAKVEGHELEETLPMKRGRILEPAVCDWYSEDTGAKLRECGTLRHPKSKVLLATPDRIATHSDGERVLEVKTANLRMLHLWGEAGTDEVPESYLVQVAAEMACAGLALGDVAVLLGGDDFRVYHLKRDEALEGMILEAVEKFYRDYVVTGKPPPPDASDSYSEWLHAKYPKENRPLLNATVESIRLARALQDARIAKKIAEADEQKARQLLEAIIGDAEGIVGPDFKITFKQSKGRQTVDWESLCIEAGVPKSLVAKHTRRNPYRVFRPSFSGESDE